MDESWELFERIKKHYGSSYFPQGGLFIRDKRLFAYSGGDTGLDSVWRGLNIANSDLSLTVEGSQLIGPSATKNKESITRAEMDSYFRGDDIKREANLGPVILDAGDGMFAPALSEGVALINILPKSRRAKK
jgi:NOL1/NOP2/fmu family ribosome biogenesis protein